MKPLRKAYAGPVPGLSPRVGIDLTALLPDATGVDAYIRGMVAALVQAENRPHLTLFVNLEDRGLFQPLAEHEGVDVIPAALRPRPVRLVFQQIALPLAARALRLDVIHSPAFVMPLWRGPQRHVLTVYDMTFFLMGHLHTRLRASRAFRAAVRMSIRRADRVVVPSRSTRDDLLSLITLPPERVEVVPPGIDERFHAPASADGARRRARLGLPEGYILHVGRLEPRKNLPLLIAAFAQLVHAGLEGDLVLAGPSGWGSQEVHAALREAGLGDRVRLLGYVEPADLPSLYAGARLMVFPSLYEGFGFPPLEAMASGVPVVASECSSLAENLAGAAELVPPDDTDALATAIQRLLTDEQLRAQHRKHGLALAGTYRWGEAATRLIDIYHDLGANHAEPDSAPYMRPMLDPGPRR
jgi:glycosyltransferase involved in cell wall biosynthesis